jgi:hypothetical protein
MFEQVKKSVICKAGSAMKGLNRKYDFQEFIIFGNDLHAQHHWWHKTNFSKNLNFSFNPFTGSQVRLMTLLPILAHSARISGPLAQMKDN